MKNKKLPQIKINSEWMGHIEKGIPEPYFGIIFGLLVILGLLLILKGIVL